MDTIIKQDNVVRATVKWSSFFIAVCMCLSVAKTYHDEHIERLKAESQHLANKSSLVTEMHKEMLSITRTQYQILHAGSHNEVRQLLFSLSDQVSSYLHNFHAFEQMADASDTHLTIQFRSGFKQWHEFNQDLLGYANVVADAGFISTLNMIDLALSQFESDPQKAQYMIAQLKEVNQTTQEMSN